MRDFRDAKAMAQTLREGLSGKAVTISHSESLELVSRMLGLADWNTLSALLKAAPKPAAVVAAVRQGGAVYPAIPIRDLVPLPGMVVPLFIGWKRTIQAVERAFEQQREVVLAVQKKSATDDPRHEDVCDVGVLAKLLEVQRLQDDTMKVLVHVNRRVAVRRFVGETDAYQAEVDDLSEGPIPQESELVGRVAARFKTFASQRDIHVTSWQPLDTMRDPGRLADAICLHMPLPLRDKQSVLEALDPLARLARVEVLMEATPLRSPETVATVRRALACATERRHRQATLEHLLLALADDKDAAAVLQGCGVDLGMLRERLTRYLDTGLNDLVVVEGEVRPTPTVAFERLTHSADARAKEAGEREVTGANYVVGLFAESRSPAARLLAEQNMTRQAALDFMAGRR